MNDTIDEWIHVIIFFHSYMLSLYTHVMACHMVAHRSKHLCTIVFLLVYILVHPNLMVIMQQLIHHMDQFQYDVLLLMLNQEG